MQKVVTKKLNFVMRSLVHTYFFVVVVDGLVEIFKDKFAVSKIRFLFNFRKKSCIISVHTIIIDFITKLATILKNWSLLSVLTLDWCE